MTLCVRLYLTSPNLRRSSGVLGPGFLSTRGFQEFQAAGANSRRSVLAKPKCPLPRPGCSSPRPQTGSIVFIHSLPPLFQLFPNLHPKSPTYSTAPPLYIHLSSPPFPLYQTRRVALRRIEHSCATFSREAP